MNFITITIIGLLVIISPGPDFLIVTQNSLKYGRKAGFQTATGVALANFCHVLLNIIGIGIIISKSIFAFTVLKILGSIYLIYFGIKTMKYSYNNKITPSDSKELRNGFFSGFTCSILNPKACLFYLSLFSVVLPAASSQYERALYGAWLCLLALIWFISVAYFFTNETIQSKLFKFKVWLERVSGTLLVACGLKLLCLKE